MITEKTTSHYGSSGKAHSFAASGTEAEIKQWADRKEKKGFSVTVNPPAGRRTEWQANAVLGGEESSDLKKSYGISKLN